MLVFVGFGEKRVIRIQPKLPMSTSECCFLILEVTVVFTLVTLFLSREEVVNSTTSGDGSRGLSVADNVSRLSTVFDILGIGDSSDDRELLRSRFFEILTGFARGAVGGNVSGITCKLDCGAVSGTRVVSFNREVDVGREKR